MVLLFFILCFPLHHVVHLQYHLGLAKVPYLLLDYNDLAELIGYWLGNEPSVDIAPAGGDGRINFLDIAEFAQHWLEGGAP